ncbi:nucleotidyltransferase family protein [Candidatus Micrarchaeota archaeon]|nr:nucleotidyltransferase family protein [Candidatus Micrarchaeota archaeon]
MGRITQALILAGGEGARLKPLTDHVPKAMVKIHGKPLLEHQVNVLKKYGVEEVVMLVYYMHEKIIDYFGDGTKVGVEVDYVIEKEPLGTAGPLKLAEKKLHENFFLGNADELTSLDLNDLASYHFKHGKIGTIFLHKVEDVSRFGVVELNGDRIVRFVEKPRPDEAPSHYINSGKYVLNRRILEFIGEGKQSMERDVFPKLAERGELIGFIPTKPTVWYTMNTLQQFLALEEEFNMGNMPWLE